MYSTCLFCSGALGRNEAIEHFPVGRRLAFDAAKGRLWVVCKSCARWNLTPLESRWEAIEEAERAYRDTRLRASTANVGLAKLKDGTELVRIGSPMLPEFAAWRYGDVFKRRWRKFRMLGTASLIVPWGYFAAHYFGLTAAEGIGTFASLGYTAYSLGQGFLKPSYLKRRVRAVVFDHNGKRYPVTAVDASKTQIIFDEASERWDVQLEYRSIVPTGRLLRALGKQRIQESESHAIRFRNDLARRALSTLLPLINAGGSNAKCVSEAVEAASAAGGNSDAFMKLQGKKATRLLREGRTTVASIPDPMRLAMEIVLHEADERRAMEGELSELEARWKEAEEIAAIADNMFLPADVTERVDALKRR